MSATLHQFLRNDQALTCGVSAGIVSPKVSLNGSNAPGIVNVRFGFGQWIVYNFLGYTETPDDQVSATNLSSVNTSSQGECLESCNAEQCRLRWTHSSPHFEFSGS